MKVFVTGASGHIGLLVVAELLEAGHQVVGLARSEESADKLRAAGAEVQNGSLDDLETIETVARTAEGVIHLAFRHDIAFSGKMDEAVEIDLKVLQTLGAALENSGKPLVGTSGTLMLAFANLDRPGLESDVLNTSGRVANENFVIGLADKNVRSSVVRLAPTVHGPRDNVSGFVPTFIKIAHDTGVSAYINEGANRWPAIHEEDAARLYLLALEKAPAGTRLHGVGDEGIAFKTIAETIGERLNVPTKSITPEEAKTHFAHLGTLAALDNPTSNAATRALLGWQPTHPGLVENLKSGNYFERYT